MLSPDIMSLLVDAFNNRLDDFVVETEDGNEGGSGYLGEMVCKLRISVCTLYFSYDTDYTVFIQIFT